MPSKRAETSCRGLLALVLLFIGFSFLMKVPTLIFEHDEPDERVYWAVAENLAERGEYTLRGAPILEGLSPRIYDRPLFHHPPLYILLLLPFVALGAPQAAVMVSWIGHAMCIVAVALMGAPLARRSGAESGELHKWLWIPLLGVATDPLLTFVSRKLWIDALLSGLVALSLACVFRGAYGDTDKRSRWLIGAGVFLGLAGLAKMPGLLVGLLGAGLLLAQAGPAARRMRSLALYLLPAALLVLPWVVTFHASYGVFLPDWLTPDPASLERSRFVSRMVGLPWYYYILKLCIAQPLVPLVAVLYGFSFRRGRGMDRWVPALWFVLFLGVATYQGIAGYGFQMRYVTPLATSVYVGLLCFPALTGPRGHPLKVPVLVLVILYAAMSGAMYLLDSRYDELLTVPELMGLLSF